MLPGGFEITAAKKYGRVSQGMICAVDELGIGEDHSGILILPPDTPLGVDFTEYAGLRDDVLEITVTPDRGYAVSIRGVARELASAYQVPYTDPALTIAAGEDASGIEQAPGQPRGRRPRGPWPAAIADPTACDRFVLREVRGFDPRGPHAAVDAGAPGPLRDAQRLARRRRDQLPHARARPAAARLRPVQAARAGRRPPRPARRDADHAGPRRPRRCTPTDILITDDSGPISLAGTMGGLATEIDDDSTDIVIEGAHFSDTGTAKMARRHRLHSEASYRFERGTDRELPLRATGRAAALLASLGGATVGARRHARAGAGRAGDDPAGGRLPGPRRRRRLRHGHRRRPAAGGGLRGAQHPVGPGADDRALARGGRSRRAEHEHGKHDRQHMILLVTPPSWRPDLTDAADLAEEVIRLEGYSNVPVRQPRATAGGGLTERQRSLRAVTRALGAAGFVEVHSEPFAPATEADSLMLAPEDPRRPAVKVANPLSEDQPQLRTTLLPGLFRTLVRNIGRGFPDTGLFEIGQVFLPRPGAPGIAPILATDRGPTEAELATLAAALPDQPTLVAGVLAGQRELPGWWGPGRAGSWADAIEAARSVGAVCHLSLDVRAAAAAPWHPGRCAALYVAVAGSDGQRHEWLAGHAGELHPRVIAAYGLPPRAGAFELDFAVLAAAAAAAAPVHGPALPAYPLATQDVALVVPRGGARRRRGGRAYRGGGGTARGRAALRRLHRRPARPGPQVARVHAAAARSRPDADRRGGDGRPRRRGVRGRPPHGRGPARVAARRFQPRQALSRAEARGQGLTSLR